jgi:hypothetical protein
MKTINYGGGKKRAAWDFLSPSLGPVMDLFYMIPSTISSEMSFCTVTNSVSIKMTKIIGKTVMKTSKSLHKNTRDVEPRERSD